MLDDAMAMARSGDSDADSRSPFTIGA
ncbi:hypothetical protein IWX85_003295 [Polaromonas sp. CG_9.11]|nr:hypothetical protein [Polaromonas sp. CG_9.11]